MRIERVEVVGFGCLTKHMLRFDPRCANLILAPNEAGKSTLLAAIEAALYGFPPKNTQEGRDLRRRFRPWSGGPSRVLLELGDKNHRYEVDFEILDAAGDSVEQLTIRRNHADVSDEMQGCARCPGEWLLGLGRDDFRRSVLVRQGELEAVANNTGQLVQQLESIATSTEAGASAAAASERLREALDDYRELAGLEHWSESYLAHARQWSRVEKGLQQAIDKREAQKRELRENRERLARRIQSFEQHNEKLGSLAKARDSLRIVEKAVQRRQLQRELDEDDRLAREITKLQDAIDAFDDVRSFPEGCEGELGKLIERESQLRRRLDEVGDKRRRCEEQIHEAKRQETQLASASALLDQAEQLREQATLFQQAVTVEKDRRDRQEQAILALEAEDCPLQRLQKAREYYKALTDDERAEVRDFELTMSSLDRRRNDAEQARRAADEQLRKIARQRKSRRINGIASVLGGLAGAVVAWWAGSILTTVLLVLSVALLALGVWLILSANNLEAYRCDQLRDQIRAAGQDEARFDDERRQRQQAVDRLAGRQGLTRGELVDAVRFYLSHHDKLDDYDLIESRWQDAKEGIETHQRRWATWLKDAGQQQPVDSVHVETALALANKVERVRTLAGELSALRKQGDALAGEERAIRDETRDAQEAIAALLKKAGIDLALPSLRCELARVEELVAVRREFEKSARRAADRKELIREQEALVKRRVDEQQRKTLQARVAGLDKELERVGAGAGDSSGALAWLRSYREDESGDVPFAAWSLDTLVVEQVAAYAERFDRKINELRESHTNTWQEARAFLKGYALKRREIDAELPRLRAELTRGARFAEAIEIASDTLQQVQSDSFRRWSQALSGCLKPILRKCLPGYELECITGDLSPVLVHESGERLDRDGIMLHLSRGAKDRLFLGFRLALAEVLGNQQGVALPLLLDDPLANWDDESLVDGLRILGDLQRSGASLIVFSCQRSRFEWAIDAVEDLEHAIAVQTLKEM